MKSYTRCCERNIVHNWWTKLWNIWRSIKVIMWWTKYNKSLWWYCNKL